MTRCVCVLIQIASCNFRTKVKVKMSVIRMSFERIFLADEACNIIFASISIDKKVMAEINFGRSDGH